MGCVVSLLAVAALVATYGTGMFPFAIGTAVLLFWANGVIANFRHNPLQAPNWAAAVSMVASLTALVLVIGGVIVRFSGGPLSWAEAADHVGDTKTVCGPLRGMAKDGGNTFVNLGNPYPSPDRFTIVVWNNTDLAEPPEGTEVCIKGEISKYQGVAQIATVDWNDLEVKG